MRHRLWCVSESKDTGLGQLTMDGDVKVALDQEVVDGLGVLVFASVCGTENGANTDGVLVDEVNSLLRVDNVAILRAIDILLLDIEVTSGLLPADLDSRVHDDVGTRVVLALCLSLVDPSLLHCQCGEHDGLGGTDSRSAHGIGFIVVGRDVEQAGDHVDTTILDISGYLNQSQHSPVEE